MKTYYKITYLDYNNATQIKRLISVEEFACYKQLNNSKIEFESLIKDKKTPQDKVKELKQEVIAIKNQLKEYSFPFFVDNSPLYDAIKTGILELTVHQGGKHNVKIELIEKYSENQTIE